jgi:hypothetical protein
LERQKCAAFVPFAVLVRYGNDSPILLNNSLGTRA